MKGAEVLRINIYWQQAFWSRVTMVTLSAPNDCHEVKKNPLKINESSKGIFINLLPKHLSVHNNSNE